MCADGDPSSSNHTEPLARRDGSFALSERWGGHAQVAVDADEAMVLHQDFESAWTLLLDADHFARRRCYDSPARRCR